MPSRRKRPSAVVMAPVTSEPSSPGSHTATEAEGSASCVSASTTLPVSVAGRGCPRAGGTTRRSRRRESRRRMGGRFLRRAQEGAGRASKHGRTGGTFTDPTEWAPLGGKGRSGRGSVPAARTGAPVAHPYGEGLMNGPDLLLVRVQDFRKFGRNPAGR